MPRLSFLLDAFIYGNDLRTFHYPILTGINFNEKYINPPHV